MWTNVLNSSLSAGGHCNDSATLFVNINYAFKWILKCSQPISTHTHAHSLTVSHSQQHHKATAALGQQASHTTTHRDTRTHRQTGRQTSGTAHQLQQQRKIGNCTKVLTRRRILPTDHRTEPSTGNRRSTRGNWSRTRRAAASLPPPWTHPSMPTDLIAI